MGGHVFVSYSRVDQAYVDRLVAAFAERGIDCWIDSKINYGSRWTKVIKDQIDTCWAFAVVMTPEAEASVWVGREIDQAETTGRPIMPLLLRGQRFFRLAEHQYVDVRNAALPSDRWFDHFGPLVGSIERPVVTKQPPINRGKAREHHNRGEALLGAGHEAQALTEFDQAVALDPEFAEAHNGRGLALRILGRWEEALAAYERAIALDPRFDLAWNNKAIVLWHLGRHAEQLAAAQRAARLNPQLEKAYNSQGLALEDLGRIDEALAAYTRAIDLNSRYYFGYNNRAMLHCKQGRFEEALADLDRAVQIDDTQAVAHQNRGQVLRALGRSAESRAAYARAVELSP